MDISTLKLNCAIVRLVDDAAGTAPMCREQTPDPQIAALIRKLQNEVRAERRADFGDEFDLECEAEITITNVPLQFDEPDYDGWARGSTWQGTERFSRRLTG